MVHSRNTYSTGSASGRFEYDDWGNPKHGPLDKRHESPLRYAVSLFRRHRTLIAAFFIGFVFLNYLRLPASHREKTVQVDWKQFAYVQYVSDTHELCNAFMIFESLQRLGSKAERVLMYPEQWDLIDESFQDRESQILNTLQANWNVKLKAIKLLSGGGEPTPGTLNRATDLDTGITKFRAFELDEYKRVLYLDNDLTLLQSLDELFLLPSTPMAMMRAYWVDGPASSWPLTSMLMLLEPNPLEFHNLLDIMQSWKLDPNFQYHMKYENELLNTRFAASAMILPHRPYGLLSAEFRRRDHAAYLGTINGPRHRSLDWDADRVLAEAKLVHFHDYPLPKPWTMWPHDGVAELQPACGEGFGPADPDGVCPERRIWKGLYDDFRKRRKQICGILSIPAPKWEDIRNVTDF